MIAFEAVRAAARRAGLSAVGWFHPLPDDGVPDGGQTLVLLGPDGPDMWSAFQAAPEAADGAPHSMDRWSQRIINELAGETGASAFFPFGGPPWQPFQKWAARGEGARSSPVTMQVTAERGLWTSYRGALSFRERLELPPCPNTDPCLTCPAPCLTACPVDAFASGSYDVPTCVAHMKSPEGRDCHNGCLIRMACPPGRAIDLPDDQRSFHMAAFLRANG